VAPVIDALCTTSGGVARDGCSVYRPTPHAASTTPTTPLRSSTSAATPSSAS